MEVVTAWLHVRDYARIRAFVLEVEEYETVVRAANVADVSLVVENLDGHAVILVFRLRDEDEFERWHEVGDEAFHIFASKVHADYC